MDKILLLHEEQDWCERVRDYLELGGYAVLEGKLNSVAQYHNTYEKADVIVLECDRIDMHVSHCEMIREMTNKPIVVLSQCGTEWEKVRMFQAGADDYMVSPYMQAELMARLKAHMSRYHRLTGPAGIIRARDLQIDTFMRVVTVRNKVVSMRLKEYDVLLYLARNGDRVVTKEEIYHAIWQTEDSPAPYTNTVAVHVMRIREKIEIDPEVPQYIQTVWGVGYQFIGYNQKE